MDSKSTSERFENVGDQESMVDITLTGLTPPLVCACPKPGPGFPTSNVVVFSEFS